MQQSRLPVAQMEVRRGGCAEESFIFMAIAAERFVIHEATSACSGSSSYMISGMLQNVAIIAHSTRFLSLMNGTHCICARHLWTIDIKYSTLSPLDWCLEGRSRCSRACERTGLLTGPDRYTHPTQPRQPWSSAIDERQSRIHDLYTSYARATAELELVPMFCGGTGRF